MWRRRAGWGSGEKFFHPPCEREFAIIEFIKGGTQSREKWSEAEDFGSQLGGKEEEEEEEEEEGEEEGGRREGGGEMETTMTKEWPGEMEVSSQRSGWR